MEEFEVVMEADIFNDDFRDSDMLNFCSDFDIYDEKNKLTNIANLSENSSSCSSYSSSGEDFQGPYGEPCIDNFLDGLKDEVDPVGVEVDQDVMQPPKQGCIFSMTEHDMIVDSEDIEAEVTPTD